jgi:hypothetical protein
VVVFTLEISGHDEKVFAYIALRLGEDLILRMPWIKKNSVIFNAGN